ncbi:MAG: hypothetical protein Q4B14_06520 [Clostridia bacterium]|nr:hypothetical protein [Clostridia bacterium]
MNFIEKIRNIINNYGEDISVIIEGKTVFSKAYIQSDTAIRHKLDSARSYVGGYDTAEKFLLIALPDLELENLPMNTLIKAQSGNYILKTVSKAFLAGKAAYISAYLEKQIS